MLSLMVRLQFLKRSSNACRGSGTSLPTAVMFVRGCGPHCARSQSSGCRSSNEQTRRKASKCYRVAGAWSAHWLMQATGQELRNINRFRSNLDAYCQHARSHRSLARCHDYRVLFESGSKELCCRYKALLRRAPFMVHGALGQALRMRCERMGLFFNNKAFCF